MREANPVEAVRWATNLMEHETYGAVSATSEPDQAGGFLVKGNWQLQEHLQVYMNRDGSPFPSEAMIDDLQTREVLEESNLEQWVNLAIAYSSPSSMD